MGAAFSYSPTSMALASISNHTLCPLYPRKRTFVGMSAMSVLCQKQTFCAAAQKSLFDQLFGAMQSGATSVVANGSPVKQRDERGDIGEDKIRPRHGRVEIDTAPIDPGNRESEGLTPNHVSELRLADVKDFVA
jgi:hypothetical protein